MRTGGGIKSLSSLFEKYTKVLIAPQSSVIATAIQVIHDVCGVEVKKNALRYTPQSRLLSLKVSGPQKTEIMLHKTEILTHIEGRIGSKNTPKNII